MRKTPGGGPKRRGIRRAGAGDKAAVKDWFLANADGLYTFVYYRVGKDADLAAEVVQETFTVALENIASYDPGRGSEFAWLTCVARNCIRRALRQRRQAASLLSRWEAIDRRLLDAYERLENAPLPEDALERQETRELVQTTLANLPCRYRDVLKSYYYLRLPLKRIAAGAGLSESATKSLLHRARLAFKAAFLTVAEGYLTAVPPEGGCHET
jgi:RNA polymerase sigma-70 factor (ECF subfamily)